MLQPLIDRIEVIEVPPYLPTEKLSIAHKYLIPKSNDEYGFNPESEKVIFTDEAVLKMLTNYCNYEAGVRNLRKCIERIFRKVVFKLDEYDTKLLKSKESVPEIETKESNTESSNNEFEVLSEGAADIDSNAASNVEFDSESQTEVQTKTEDEEESNIELEADSDAAADTENDYKDYKVYQINSNNLEQFLDVPNTDDYYYEKINETLPIGCANGLAYIDSGYGSVLKIQFTKRSFTKDKGQLSQTGRLGDVMKESFDVVQVATFNFLQSEFDYTKEEYEENSYHLHVPQGAIPKDGPSAGVALFISLVSVIQNKPLKPNLAMTGEITTLGEVVSIGGVREKLTACKNHNITRVILPFSNKKHFDKLPEEFKEGFEIFFVKDIKDVYKL